MKIKYLIGFMLILGVALQFFRVNPLNEIVDVIPNPNIKEINYTSAKDIPLDEDKYLILISHIDGDEQTLILKNIEEVFRYAKVNYDIRTLKSLQLGEIYKYRGILIATQNYKLLYKGVYEEIKGYVKEGNFLVILINSYFNPLNKVSGIEKIHEYKNENGIVFKKPIFPGFIDTPIVGDEADNISNSMLDIKLNKNVKMIATSANGSPLIFQKNVGRGRIIYTNATFFSDRSVNAFLLQLISYSSNYFLQSIINTKIIDIDDFPAPLPRGKNKIIYSEYKVNTRKFFREIWWNDIKNLAKEKNLIFSGFFIGTYEDITHSDNFDEFDQNDTQDKIYFGRELLSIGGELGIHGYNHQPLGFASELNQNHNYRNWESIEDMKKAVTLIKDDFIDSYGGLEPKVYVPPSNMLGPSGKKVLRETIPSLEVLAGLYSGGNEKGVLITEIGWDKDEPTLYNLPRFSSDLNYSNLEMLNIYQGIALYGIVHHFFHPDDLLDPERNMGKNWETLKKEFSIYLDNINEKFGFLRAQTAYDGFREALKLENLKIHSVRNNNNIDIYFENFPGKTYHYFRIRNKKVDEVIGGKITSLSFDGETTLYLLEAHKNKITIKLK